MQSLRKLHAELQRAGASGADSAPPLTWLFDCGGIPSDSRLDVFATYGQGIAPEKVGIWIWRQYVCCCFGESWCCRCISSCQACYAEGWCVCNTLCGRKHHVQHLDTLQGLLEGLSPAAACGRPPANSCSAAGPHCAGSMAAPPGSNAAAPDIDLVRRAAARGLYVHPWTVRQEVSAIGSCRCNLVGYQRS